MIIVRNTFRLKFGKAKEAIALWKEGKQIMEKHAPNKVTIMTDLVGESYTLVCEMEVKSLLDVTAMQSGVYQTPDWVEWYQRFVPLVESARRDVYQLLL